MEGSSARVQSVDSLRAFRIALIKFVEASEVALADADSEMQRAVMWLEHEQMSTWASQVRKRTEDVARAKEALRMKKLFKGADGRSQSSVDEEKALALAMRRLAEAEHKLKSTQAWARRLPKEIMLYKGQAARFSSALQSDIPTAAAHLGALVQTLEQYLALSASSGAGGASDGPLVSSAAAGAAGMARGDTETVEQGSRRWRFLRARTPAGAERGAAPIAETLAPLKPAVLAAVEIDQLAAVKADRIPPDPQAKVVVAKSALEGSRAYFERTEVSFPGDSGWFIGPVDDAPASPATMVTVSALLAARPDLQGLIALPRGFLAVIDGGGMTGLLDGQDQEQWSR